MSWIKIIPEDEAEGELHRVYEETLRNRGKIANVIRVHSLNSEAMSAHLNLYVTIMFGKSDLTRPQREMIATAVSALNHCDYCVNHHAEALNFYWKNVDRIKKFVGDPEATEIEEKDRSMLRYAIKLTRAPWRVIEEDLEQLRKVGFTDRDILDMTLITSYFNFVNRIASGLGVKFDAGEISGYKY